MTITGITESVVVRTAYSNNTRMLGVMMRLPDGRPIIANLKKVSEDKWKCVAVGPTTSMRMEKAEKEFLAATGVKIVIGKGGMGPKTTEGCKESKAVHTIFPGGCAVVAAECIERVDGVEWLDLGMPEAMWKFKAKEFGPLIVSIDCHGGNLIDDNKVKFNERKEKLVPEISEKVQFMH